MEKATQLTQIQNVFMPEPLTNKEEMAEFYVDTSYARYGDEFSSIADELEIELIDSTMAYVHKLFIGHTGSGKSTELHRLEERLINDGFCVTFIEGEKEIDIKDAIYTDLLFLILDKLLQTAEAKELQLSENLYERVKKYWESIYTFEEIDTNEAAYSLEAEAGANAKALVLSLLSKVRGVLKTSEETKQTVRRNVEPRSSELVNQIIDIVQAVTKQLQEKQAAYTILVILLDGTDKMSLDAAKKIFYENGMKFTDLPLHIIISFPIALSYAAEYNDIQAWFPSPYKLPMIKQRKWIRNQEYELFEEGPKAMKEIVEKRMELGLFEPGVLEKLIRDTGGSIRDLFRCIRKAALRARVKHVDVISENDAQYALNELKSDINGRYNSHDIPELQTIYSGDKERLGEESIKKLLQTGAVMEYNARRWCDLHPLVEAWLKDTGRIQ